MDIQIRGMHVINTQNSMRERKRILAWERLCSACSTLPSSSQLLNQTKQPIKGHSPHSKWPIKECRHRQVSKSSLARKRLLSICKPIGRGEGALIAALWLWCHICACRARGPTTRILFHLCILSCVLAERKYSFLRMWRKDHVHVPGSCAWVLRQIKHHSNAKYYVLNISTLTLLLLACWG